MVTIILIFLILIGLYKYNTKILITYIENEAPKGGIVWNTGITINIKVLNNGTIIKNKEKDKIDKESLKELKDLLKQLEDNIKENDNASYNKFIINNKTYAESDLNEKELKILSEIKNIIY